MRKDRVHRGASRVTAFVCSRSCRLRLRRWQAYTWLQICNACATRHRAAALGRRIFGAWCSFVEGERSLRGHEVRWCKRVLRAWSAAAKAEREKRRHPLSGLPRWRLLQIQEAEVAAQKAGAQHAAAVSRVRVRVRVSWIP